MEIRHSLEQLAEAHRLLASGRHQALVAALTRQPAEALARSATMCLLLGTAYARLGRQGEASRWVSEAMALSERQRDWSVLARSRNVLGLIALEVGRIDDAAAHLKRGLELARRFSDALNVGRCSANLGVIASLRGGFDEAIAWYTLAIAAYQQAGHDIGLVQVHHNLGIVYLDQGMLVKALDAADKALDYALRIEDVGLQAQARAGRAEIRLRHGDAPFAAREIRQALETHRDAGDVVGEAEDLRVLALTLAALGDREEAETVLHDVMERAERLDRPLLGAWARRDLAFLLDEPHRAAEARAVAEEALRVFERLGAAREITRLRDRFGI